MSTNERKLISVFFILAALAILNYFGFLEKDKKALAEEQKREERTQIYNQSFGALALEAKSAFVYSPPDQRIIFRLNENKPLPLASIAKIMTAIVASENVPDDAVLEISRSALSEEGDNGLFVGEKWGRDELLKFMLFVSSNDAAKATEEYVGPDFIRLMNDKAVQLGLQSMKFLTSSGLDMGGAPGAIGSARDVMMLFAHALKKYPDIFDSTSRTEQIFESLSGFKHSVQNTNKLADLFPQIIASKTGLTALAGGNLVIAFDYGIQSPVIVVVLGSSEQGRFEDAFKLSQATISYLSKLAKVGE